MKTNVTEEKTVAVVEENGDYVLDFKVDENGDVSELSLFLKDMTILEDRDFYNKEVHAFVDDLLVKVKRLHAEIYAHVPKKVAKKK